MTDQLVLVGGGGHCKSCIEVIESCDLKIAGIVDKGKTVSDLPGYKILGGDEVIQELARKGFIFLITVGQLRSSDVRKKLFGEIRNAGGIFARVYASTAIVSKHAQVQEGSIVMHHAQVNASASVGINCIVNNKALIEHDAVIGDHTHISTGALVNGGCRIGSGVFIGSGAVIANGVEIADEVVIGAGAVVIRNITEKGVYAGNPAQRIDK